MKGGTRPPDGLVDAPQGKTGPEDRFHPRQPHDPGSVGLVQLNAANLDRDRTEKRTAWQLVIFFRPDMGLQ